MRAVLAIFFLLILAPAAAAAPNVEIRRTYRLTAIRL